MQKLSTIGFVFRKYLNFVWCCGYTTFLNSWFRYPVLNTLINQSTLVHINLVSAHAQMHDFQGRCELIKQNQNNENEMKMVMFQFGMLQTSFELEILAEHTQKPNFWKKTKYKRHSTLKFFFLLKNVSVFLTRKTYFWFGKYTLVVWPYNWCHQWSHVIILSMCAISNSCTAQKMKFSIKDFFGKCDQIRSFLQVCSHLLKKSLMWKSFFVLSLFLEILQTKGVLKNEKNWITHMFSLENVFG